MEDTNLLFVYGTLMRGIKSYMSKFLERNSRFIGIGYFEGRLFDLGSYPGLVKDNNSPYKVLGHIFEINEFAVLKQLDIYEGNPTGFSEDYEYVRKLANVNFNTTVLKTWIYLYNRPVQGLKEITSGNYLGYVQINPSHQRFIQSV